MVFPCVYTTFPHRSHTTAIHSIDIYFTHIYNQLWLFFIPKFRGNITHFNFILLENLCGNKFLFPHLDISVLPFRHHSDHPACKYFRFNPNHRVLHSPCERESVRGIAHSSPQTAQERAPRALVLKTPLMEKHHGLWCARKGKGVSSPGGP